MDSLYKNYKALNLCRLLIGSTIIEYGLEKQSDLEYRDPFQFGVFSATAWWTCIAVYVCSFGFSYRVFHTIIIWWSFWILYFIICFLFKKLYGSNRFEYFKNNIKKNNFILYSYLKSFIRRPLRNFIIYIMPPSIFFTLQIFLIDLSLEFEVKHAAEIVLSWIFFSAPLFIMQAAYLFVRYLLIGKRNRIKKIEILISLAPFFYIFYITTLTLLGS